MPKKAYNNLYCFYYNIKYKESQVISYNFMKRKDSHT